MKCTPIDIKCPDCKNLALFEEPFEFQSSKDTPANETQSSYRWGGWTVVERFPSLIKWKAPSGSSQYLRHGGNTSSGGYPLLNNGLVLCPACHSNRKHKLSWPHDAYWQWEIRGEILWAWDKNHAEEILTFVKKVSRPSQRPSRLWHLPSHFLSAKMRDLVVQKIERSVNAQPRSLLVR
jgi:hypothetical protein